MNDKYMSTIRDNEYKVDKLIGDMRSELYGTDSNSKSAALNDSFDDIINNVMKSITGSDKLDHTSFLSKLINSDDSRYSAGMNQLYDTKNIDIASMEALIDDKFKNSTIKLAGLANIADKLNELKEAVSATADAILCSNENNTETGINLNITFAIDDEAKKNQYISIVKRVEDKFKLRSKIKRQIVNKTLSIGESYAYNIPYSELFKSFANNSSMLESTDDNLYKTKDRTILECVEEEETIMKESVGYRSNTIQQKKTPSLVSSIYTEYFSSNEDLMSIYENDKDKMKMECEKAITNILNNIIICDESTPLAIYEEGANSLKEFKDKVFVESANGNYVRKSDIIMESSNSSNMQAAKGLFHKVINDEINKSKSDSDATDGVISENDFSDINDCYIKIYDRIRVLPLKIVDECLAYYVIIDEDVDPMYGIVNGTLVNSIFSTTFKNRSIIDNIAERIVKSFNKKFLMDNIKFKKTIADAIEYYNITEKKIKLKFVPREYMCRFHINEDENGNGVSMLDDSLFFGQLYLMFFIYKMIQNINYGQDEHINYVRTSGISQDIANKIQEQIRKRQQRKVTVNDLFNIGSVLNKVSRGSETYIPVGKNNEGKGMETEIIQAQEVNMNTEFMEILKNGYVMGTHTPATIINALSEAEYSKGLEQQWVKWTSSVISDQIDLGEDIANWYKTILRITTTIPPQDIEKFRAGFQKPRINSNTTKSEMINSFNDTCNFVLGLFSDMENSQELDDTTKNAQRIFRRKVCTMFLPNLNLEELKKIYDDSLIEAEELKLQPRSDSGDSGEDLGGLGDFDIND